jgi:hypothetical protein
MPEKTVPVSAGPGLDASQRASASKPVTARSAYRSAAGTTRRWPGSQRGGNLFGQVRFAHVCPQVPRAHEPGRSPGRRFRLFRSARCAGQGRLPRFRHRSSARAACPTDAVSLSDVSPTWIGAAEARAQPVRDGVPDAQARRGDRMQDDTERCPAQVGDQIVAAQRRAQAPVAFVPHVARGFRADDAVPPSASRRFPERNTRFPCPACMRCGRAWQGVSSGLQVARKWA